MENQEKTMKIFVDERHKSTKTREISSHFAVAAEKFDQKMPKIPVLNLPKTCYSGAFLRPSTKTRKELHKIIVTEQRD